MKLAMLAATLATAVAAPVAWADPPPWAPAHGHHKHKHHDRDDDDEYEHRHERVRVIEVERAPRTIIVEQPAPRPVVVYPPWIVQQQGQYVYAPQYQPAPMRGAISCNSAAVGTVLGGIVGGALGSQIGGGNGRTIATVGGVVTGALVGGDIGRRIDSGNQACVGQVLEVAPVGRRVQWVESNVTYVVVPGRVEMRHGNHCRPYTLQMQVHGGWQRTQGWACRRPGGVWVAA